MAIEALSSELLEAEKKIDDFESTDFASEDHYHDEYAIADHVDRSENSFNSQLYQIKNDISNLEYRISDAERKAESAQRAADIASRNSRGGW